MEVLVTQIFATRKRMPKMMSLKYVFGVFETISGRKDFFVATIVAKRPVVPCEEEIGQKGRSEASKSKFC